MSQQVHTGQCINPENDRLYIKSTLDKGKSFITNDQHRNRAYHKSTVYFIQVPDPRGRGDRFQPKVVSVETKKVQRYGVLVKTREN